LESNYQQFKDQGFTVVTVLIDGNNPGVGATEADVAAWQSLAGGLNHPVVGAPGTNPSTLFNPFIGWPSYKLLRAGMEVVLDDPWPFDGASMIPQAL
jgi:hypothetical protein